ncbi:MAG: hypothetical protein Q9203_001143 [Teloschistes exilis]
MQYTIAIWLATLSAICAGQGVGLGDLPDCAKPCAATLPPNCGLSVQCICSDKDWITGISCCVKGKCSEAEQQKTIQVAQQICDTVIEREYRRLFDDGRIFDNGKFVDHDWIGDDGFEYNERAGQISDKHGLWDAQ